MRSTGVLVLARATLAPKASSVYSRVPPLCFVLEVVEPGLLVVKHRRAGGFGKFVNVAVLRGDHLQLIDEAHGGLADCPALRAFLPGRTLPAPATGETDNVLLELAAAMRAHGRGGLDISCCGGRQSRRRGHQTRQRDRNGSPSRHRSRNRPRGSGRWQAQGVKTGLQRVSKRHQRGDRLCGRGSALGTQPLDR